MSRKRRAEGRRTRPPLKALTVTKSEKARGLKSQGMVLAASDTDRIVILMPEKTVNPGAKVS